MHCAERLRTLERASPGLTARARTVVYNEPSKSIRIIPRKLQHTQPVPSNSMESTLKKDTESTCVLCCQDIDMFAVGKCDHPVCYRCSTKMRVLCEQKYCAVCREQLDKVPPLLSSPPAARAQASGYFCCTHTSYTRNHGLTTPITLASMSIHNGSGCVCKFEMTWKGLVPFCHLLEWTMYLFE